MATKSNDSDWFDLLVSDYGGPAQPSRAVTLALPVLGSILLGYQQLVQSEDLSIRGGLVDDSDFNAFATLSPDNEAYGIIINQGLCEELWNTVDLLAPVPLGSEDKCEDEAYRAHLYWLAFSFIVEHELSHVFNGHLHLPHASQGRLDEFKRSQPGDEQYLTSQTLEYDADCTAASRVGLWARNHVLLPGKTNPLTSSRFATTALIWFDFFLALSITFRLFGTMNGDPNAGFSTHPASATRLHYSKLVLGTACSEYGIQDLGEFVFQTDGLSMAAPQEEARKQDHLHTDVQIEALARYADLTIVKHWNNQCLIPKAESNQPHGAQSDVAAFRSRWTEIHKELSELAPLPIPGQDGRDGRDTDDSG